MCTVTLLASEGPGQNFILTSSRDEAAERTTLPPAIYHEQGVKMLYPKDAVAGGTWIGVSSRQRLLCLLNGGFKNHERQEIYRKSRGIVAKDFLAAPNIGEAVNNYDLNGIEPFTVIIVEWGQQLKFSEFVWDGEKRHYQILKLQEHLWSSSPLYNSEMKNTRSNWFKEFLKDNQPSAESLWQFHHTGGIGDKAIDIVMDRGFVKTKSITQIVKNASEVKMRYKDLETAEVSEHQF